MGNARSLPTREQETPASSYCFSGTTGSMNDTSIDSDSTFCEPDSPKRRSCKPQSDFDTRCAYEAFLRVYLEYRLTWSLDNLRETDFSRLDRAGETYVDYMGGALYPERLIQAHSTFLSESIMGNTHSISNSSRLSTTCANEARQAVLDFFHAPPGYTVIFTPNATGALKLIGESFPFTQDSEFVLGADSHNSVHGIREFASRCDAQVSYISSTTTGGFDELQAKDILDRRRPRCLADGRTTFSLYAQTGQSNISNAKTPLSVLMYASALGFHTLLDAAALAPTSIISLTDTPIDAMAVSFYKMFGYPTGCGCLVVKESLLRILKRPWFAGGNVDVVQVPGNLITRATSLSEQFEDGTINYLMLPAVTEGLSFLSTYLPLLPLRLSSLLHFLTSSLLRLRHTSNNTPVVQILSRLPVKRLKSVNNQSDTGSTVSLIFLDPSGVMLPNSFVEYAASSQRISLRTGCMCNPGGAAAILGICEYMDQLYPGVTLKDFEDIVGHELGVVRISLGLASSFKDAWNVLRFAATLGCENSREILWEKWLSSLQVAPRMGEPF